MKKSTPVQWLIRIVFYCLGLLLMAFGVALSVNSNLGVSPVNSLPYVISRILNVQMGTCVTVIFCFYILLQAVILGREFPVLNLLQIAASTIFGYFVNFAKAAIGGFVLPGYAGKLVMLAASIALIAFGMTLYMDTHISSMPMEGLSHALAKKLNRSFPAMKTATDCASVAMAMLLGFGFLGTIDGLREGTVITALVVGKMIALFRKPVSPLMKKICFGE